MYRKPNFGVFPRLVVKLGRGTKGVNVISLKNIRKSFGNHEVLKDISFDVEEGSRVSLLGPGGCGKSIILKIIIGLLEPDEGSVTLMDQEMAKASEEDKEKVLRHVGMAFQQGALFDFMTVRENLRFAMEHMTEDSSEEMESKIEHLLQGVKLPRSKNQFPFELSGGMQRRVGIARALSTNPKVAIFDEPTSGLDPVTSTVILNMIHDLAGHGDEASERQNASPTSMANQHGGAGASSSRESEAVTQLVATSNVEIAIRFAPRLIIINDGLVVADGDWRELLVNGPEWVRHFLSVRLIGLDFDYAKDLDLPESFLAKHWDASLRGA